MSQPNPKSVPADSIIFGYGPMLPLLAAAIGSWTLPLPWPGTAETLAIIWGALVLTFVGGVRRGFGFGRAGASKPIEIVTMMVYFTLAGLALVSPWRPVALALLASGFAVAAVSDTIAARRGNAPAHFAKLRPSQFGIAVVSLLALLAHLALA